MAQAATLLALDSTGTELDDQTIVYFAGIDAARFKRPVEPGDQLLLDVTLDRTKAGIYKFTGKAWVDKVLAAEAQLICTMRRIDA
jgi:3-hydroxyacyl-[acyl-carrier-protein] dehydratase